MLRAHDSLKCMMTGLATSKNVLADGRMVGYMKFFKDTKDNDPDLVSPDISDHMTVLKVSAVIDALESHVNAMQVRLTDKTTSFLDKVLEHVENVNDKVKAAVLEWHANGSDGVAAMQSLQVRRPPRQVAS